MVDRSHCPVCGETRFESWTYCPACQHSYPDDEPGDDEPGDDDESDYVD